MQKEIGFKNGRIGLEIKILTVRLEGSKVKDRDIPKIRGYLAERFPSVS